MDNPSPLSPSLLALARKLDDCDVIPLARVFGSGGTAPASARDLDLAFFCPHDYAKTEGYEFAQAVSRQVLGCANRSSGHYGELDVFIFFADRTLVRNSECNGWDVAKNAKSIKAAAITGQPWADFMQANDPQWSRASCPPHRLRHWVCSEKSYPLDEPAVASMVRAGADLSPWINHDNSPRNILTEALGWGHLSLVPLLVAGGAPLTPSLPPDPDEILEFSGEAYYPAVAALVNASDAVENEGLEEGAEKIKAFIDLAAIMIKAGADPLQVDLGGNPMTAFDAYMLLAMAIHNDREDWDISSSAIPATMGGLMDALLEALPDDMGARWRQDVLSGAIREPGHQLHNLTLASSVMDPWLASVGHADLEGRVAPAKPTLAQPSPRM